MSSTGNSLNGEVASDFDDDLQSKTSQVYLGFVDAAIKESDTVSIEDTFIGGEPIWMHEDSVPPAEMLQCGVCKSDKGMKLLLQAFAPLDPEQVDEICNTNKITLSSRRYIDADLARTLYVFICTNCKVKGNTVKCIRGVKKNRVKTHRDELSEKMNDSTGIREFKINPFDLDGSNIDTNLSISNPFASSGGDSSNPFAKVDNPFDSSATENKKLKPSTIRKLHDAQEDKKFDVSKSFPGFFLFVEEESFKNKVPDHLKLPDNIKIDSNSFDISAEVEDIVKTSSKLDPRAEKLSKFLDDSVFQKFQELVGYNPGQVLRYDLGGKPLYYAEVPKNFEDTIPRPAHNPSSVCIFEMQLMPKMIMDLEKEVSIQCGMEWGTIMVFSDISNHVKEFDDNGVAYMEECVRVQWEVNK